MAMWDRTHWDNRLKFTIYVTAFLFSPNAIWEFPQIWKTGGGLCLLIPLIVFLLALGLPIMFLELSLGQFMQGAGTRIWGVAPLFKGLTISSLLVGLLRSTMNLPLMGWAGYYLYLSLSSDLPSCINDVNVNGATISKTPINESSSKNYSYSTETNLTILWNPKGGGGRGGGILLSYEDQGYKTVYDGLWNDTCTKKFESLWWIQTLNANPTLILPGAAVIHIFFGVVVAFFICFLLLIRSFNTQGTIMYVLTPLSAALLLATLLGAGLNGRGFEEGIGYLLLPRFSALGDIETWASCIRQTLLILGLGVHVLPTLASFNRFSNDCYRDCFVLSLFALLIHVMSSVVLFAILGDDAGNQKMKNVDGPAFLFILVTKSLSRFNNSIIWSSLFFIAVILITLTTTVIYVECLVASIVDISAKLKRWRILILSAILSLAFLFSIAITTQGGIYVHSIYHRVSDGGLMTSIICLLQCIVMGYIYGGRRFYDNIGAMTGRQLHWWIRVCWTYLSPLILLASICYHGYRYYQQPISLGVEHPYHYLSSVLLLSLVVMMLMPVVAVAVWILFSVNEQSFKRRLRASVRPKLRPYQIPITWRLNANRKRMLKF